MRRGRVKKVREKSKRQIGQKRERKERQEKERMASPLGERKQITKNKEEKKTLKIKEEHGRDRVGQRRLSNF